MHAQTLEAAQWWAQPRGATTASWIANYQKSLRSRHRDVIAGIVKDLGATSVLEVGSHCGPNLVRIAQDCPGVEQLTGIDVNADAVAAGARWAHGLGLSDRIQLVAGRVPEMTAGLADRSADVVLSCYALAYIAPADLDAVLWEMGRLATRAIVIAEPMATPTVTTRRSLSGYTEWAHDYRAASRWIGTWHGMTLTTRAVYPPVDQLQTVLVAVRDGG